MGQREVDPVLSPHHPDAAWLDLSAGSSGTSLCARRPPSSWGCAFSRTHRRGARANDSELETVDAAGIEGNAGLPIVC
jgi:hypothetical protein